MLRKKGWALGRKLAVEHTDLLREKGMIVAEPTEQLQSEMRAIGQTMITQWLDEAGSEGKAIIDAFKAQ